MKYIYKHYYNWIICFSFILRNSDDDGWDDGLLNTNKKGFNLEEGSKDSEEDNLPNFIDDASNMVLGVKVANDGNNHNNGKKRKATQQSTHKSKREKKKVMECDRNVFNIWIDWLITCLE